MSDSSRVTIYEVGPRDGLQNEGRVVSTADKLRLIASLQAAGLRDIEATSFVSPRWIPQLADAAEVCAGLVPSEGVRYTALVPNLKGWERARSHPSVGGIAVVLSASETHNRKNLNRPIDETLSELTAVVGRAKAEGRWVRAYISTVWGCPYEGEVDPHRALEIALELRAAGADQLSLGDTIGVGTPGQTRRICELFLKRIDAPALALHMHDTRGQALVNAFAGWQCGIRTFDASIGGMGGCPYAPGASGNLATEDLAYMLAGLGADTGLRLDALVEAGALAQSLAGRPLPGRYLQSALAARAQACVAAGGSTHGDELAGG